MKNTNKKTFHDKLEKENNYDRESFIDALRKEGRSYSECSDIATEWERQQEKD